MSDSEQTDGAVAEATEAIALSGALDITVVTALESKIDTALGLGGDVLITVRDVERVDASVAQLLHLAAIECRNREVTFSIEGICPALDQALRSLGLDGSITRL